MIDELGPPMDEIETSRVLKVAVFDSENPEHFMAHYNLLVRTRAGRRSA